MVRLSQVWRCNFLQIQFKLAAEHQEMQLDAMGTQWCSRPRSWLCPSPFPGSRAYSMPSGSLLSSSGLAAQLPCRLWHRILIAWSFLVLFPFAVSPESLPQLGAGKGSAVASLKHPEDAAWKRPWNTGGALASRKRAHGASPDFSWQDKV